MRTNSFVCQRSKEEDLNKLVYLFNGKIKIHWNQYCQPL